LLRIGAIGPRLDPAAGLDRVERASRLPAERLLDDDAFDAGKLRDGFVDGGLVAGNQGGADAEAAGERGVQGRLALLAAVDAQPVDRPTAVGVIYDGALAPHGCVVADEEGDLEGRVEPGPHG